jgi:hypothetical protein
VVRGVALGVALAAGVATAAAQGPPATPAPIRISVITIGQGDEVFERFGHNALRVQDPATGLDVAYNWGMFSFDEPGFIRRFLSGDTRYWVEAIPTDWMLEQYAKADRKSEEQVLALTPEEAARVAALAAESALPANKYYRYDYFLDNCSTRVRDLLDRALGGALQRRFGEMRTPWTFRSESVRLTEPSAFAQAGIDIALGPRADTPITAWQSMFIPMRLRDHLRTVTITGPDGAATPLVSAERVLYEARRAPEAAERRGLALGPWGPLLAVWMLLLVPWSAVVRRRTRVPAAVMTVLWYGFTAVLGVALAGMWIGSAHVFWYDNLNLLLLSPLGLVAAVPVARAILRGALTPLSRVLLLVMLAQVVLAILLAPVVRQTLAGPILLFAPAHLGLALAAWRHTHLGTAAAAPVGSAR